MRDDSTSMWQLIISGIIGGIFTLLLFPVVRYFLTRFLATLQTRILIDPPNKNEKDKYVTLNLRIRNRSFVTLKNLIVFIRIPITINDVEVDYASRTYSTTSLQESEMLSWARIVNGRNESSIDINQAQNSDLNLFRYHLKPTLPLIEIASEQGFYNYEWNNKSRIYLKSHRDYPFEILLTADNMIPKKKKFIFDQANVQIREA